MIFPAWQTFTRVLDDPRAVGFAQDDVVRERGGIWVDHLHPTSAMHKIVADELAAFLEAQGPYVEKSDVPVMCPVTR